MKDEFKPKPGYRYHTDATKKHSWRLIIEGHESFTLTDDLDVGLDDLKKYAKALTQYCQDVDKKPMTQVRGKHHLFNNTGEY